MRTSYTLAYSRSRFRCIQVHLLASSHIFSGYIFRYVVINNTFSSCVATKVTHVRHKYAARVLRNEYAFVQDHDTTCINSLASFTFYPEGK